VDDRTPDDGLPPDGFEWLLPDDAGGTGTPAPPDRAHAADGGEGAASGGTPDAPHDPGGPLFGDEEPARPKGLGTVPPQIPEPEGWRTRRSDRHPPRRRKRGSGTLWRRRLVALALLVAVIVLIALVVAALTRGGSDKKGDGGAVAGKTTAPPSSTTGASSSPSPSPSVTTTPDVRVISGGDVMGDRQVEAYANANGGDAVLRGIAPVLKKGDAAWVNIEGPLTRLGSPYPGKDVTFQGSPLIASALGRSGLDVVTMGNNHAVDYGQAALVDTIKRIEKGHVKVVGAGRNDADAWTPAIVQTDDGATIGFLAWTDIVWPGYVASNGPGVAAARTDVTRMKNAIRKLSRKVDYVVVGYHWGIEYQHYPITDQTSEAHAAVDAGADLVIGHHPHVLQGIEVYKGALIVYSLGDLAFDHSDIETGQTVLVDAELTPKGVTATLIPVYSSSAGIPAVQRGGGATTILDLVRQYSAPFHTKIRISGNTATVTATKKK